ncbi:hypothetical protein CPLU01_02254 [Colletotrichum plurivorum]|uniref:Uncharacterized protein n=1 Tax=Colletotrichum plurivorum TaxID=2175906 RepID=A0A8H6KXH3_9PEZI|nr:hypothetical protein CPLU01_02254 [Colletotrichum plurivorum]
MEAEPEDCARPSLFLLVAAFLSALHSISSSAARCVVTELTSDDDQDNDDEDDDAAANSTSPLLDDLIAAARTSVSVTFTIHHRTTGLGSKLMRAFGDQSPCPEIAIVAQNGDDETRISRLTALFCLEDEGGISDGGRRGGPPVTVNHSPTRQDEAKTGVPLGSHAPASHSKSFETAIATQRTTAQHSTI